MIIKPSGGGQTKKKNIHLLPCLSGISCPATSSSCECLERKRASDNILAPAFSCCTLMSLARRYVKRRASLRSHVDSRDDGNVRMLHVKVLSPHCPELPTFHYKKEKGSPPFENHEVSFTHLHADESYLNYGIPQMVPTHINL